MSTRSAHPEPVVSVLLPVHNGGAHLIQALESLSAQTLREIEIVVIDDGSSDTTWQVLCAYAEHDGRLRALRQVHRGLAAALNAALTSARAPYVARMDADDLAHPERLESQVALLESDAQLAAVGCQVRCIGESVDDGWRAYESWSNACCTPEEIANERFVESPLVHPSVMMRRSVVMALGGYREFDGPEDYDLWLRMAHAGYRLAKIPRVLLEWRDHPHRATHRDPRYRPEAFIALKAAALSAGPLAAPQVADRPVLIWGAGRYGGKLASALRASQRPASAFIDVDPAKIGRTRHNLPIFGPEDAQAAPGCCVILSAVALPHARQQIRTFLRSRGHREGTDFWACA